MNRVRRGQPGVQWGRGGSGMPPGGVEQPAVSPARGEAPTDLGRLVSELRGAGIIAMLLGFAFQGFNGGRKLVGDALTARMNSGLVFLLQLSGWGLVWAALTSPAGELGASNPADVVFRLGRPGGLAFLGLLRLFGFIAAGQLPEVPPVRGRAG